MADFTIQALHDEIVNDPQSIGYKNVHPSSDPADWKGDQEIATLINDPANGATITRKLITPQEISHSIVHTEVTGANLSDDERWWLERIMDVNGGFIDANESSVFTGLNQIFSNAEMPNSRANILAKLQKQGSRAEVLWGEGKVVTAGEVGAAANV